jgi:hypothetical protein
MQIRKKGDEIEKKSSPLKLLSQSQPSFAEVILGWSSSNVIFYQNMPNLHNRYKSAERKLSQKNPEYMLNNFCRF